MNKNILNNINFYLVNIILLINIHGWNILWIDTVENE